MDVAEPDVPNYLTQAILLTIFGLLCSIISFPLGVVAIVYSSQVNQKLAVGDFEGAMASSKKAKLWCLITFWTCFVIFIVFVVFAWLVTWGSN